MKTSKELRGEAWEALWVHANILKLVGAWMVFLALAFTAYFAVTIALGTTPTPFEPRAVSPAANLLLRFVATVLQSVFALGVAAQLLAAIRGEKTVFAKAFVGFSCPLRTLWLHLILGFYTMIWLLPGALLFLGAVVYAIRMDSFYLVAIPYSFFVLYALAVTYRFRLVWFVRAARPELGAVETVKTAVKMIDGHKMRLFRLDLSYILASLWLFVPVIGWAILFCYVALGTAAFYRDLAGND